MKKNLVAIAITAFTTASLSTPASAKMQRQVQEVCNRWAYLAEQVMHARQAGRSRDWIHNITDEMTSSRVIDHVNRINRMAFNRPILSRDADKARAEEDFGEDIFDICLDEGFPELQR